MNKIRNIFGSRLILSAVFLPTALLLPQLAAAGTAVMTGYGEVSAPAEFVLVSVAVKSECFPSAMAVSSTNDDLANRALQLLRSHADSARQDEVAATGGYVERYTGYRPNNAQPICVQQFRKQNQLTLKLHGTESFSRVFAEIQDGLYALSAETEKGAIDQPTSFIEISTPVTGLSPSTLAALEKRAIGIALQDAKDKFQVTLALSGITTYKIEKYAEVGQNQGLPFDSVSRMKSPGFPQAPVEFGQLKVTKVMSVQFQFEGGALQMR